jgi:hypothetical protein
LLIFSLLPSLSPIYPLDISTRHFVQLTFQQKVKWFFAT